jgi:type IV pilus assembly protein PilM
MKKFLSFLSNEKELLAVDIGSSSIKIIIFKNEKKQLKIKTWGHIPLNLKPDINTDEKKAIIADEISKFIKKMSIQTKYAVTSVSGNSVIVRYIKLPKMTKKELDVAIKVEAEPFIPFDINDIYLSYYILNDNITEEGQAKMEVVLIASKKDVVDERIDILGQAGLEPVIIDVDAFAIENLISNIESIEKDKTTLVLNMGNKVTNLSILSARLLNPEDKNQRPSLYSRVVREIFIAGSSLDKAIAKQLNITLEQACEFKKTVKLLVSEEDKIKAINEYDKNLILGSKISMGIIKDICAEVSRSIDFYLSQGVDHSISKIYITGGFSSMGGLSSYLSREFKIPVEILNPIVALGDIPKNMPEDVALSMSVCCGLALRKLKDWE